MLDHSENRWIQRTIRLGRKPRGFHLVTREITAQLPELKEVAIGILHLFLQHTSASICINENADPDVRRDMETAMNHVVPESLDYVHTLEGADDMPAHVKSSLIGVSLSIPVGNGSLLLGTWQGIYLCEHRDAATERSLVATLCGTTS